VERNFSADGPDKLWVADITYVPTWSGFLFLAVVLDVFSRRVVGWAMATHLRRSLVLDALDMAIYQRKPKEVIDPSLGSRNSAHVDCVRAAMSESRRPTVDGIGRRLL
jgi:putative transposase